MNLDEFNQQLAAGDGRTEAVARALSQFFQVQTDEIGIFAYQPNLEIIRFLWPRKLQSLGFLPLSSPDSLAAKTLRENKAYLNNRFATTIHPSIFEKVKLDKEKTEAPTPVQKILSVPLQVGGVKTGVVQICRKGPTPAEAGVDFSKEDLAALVEIARKIAPLLEVQG